MRSRLLVVVLLLTAANNAFAWQPCMPFCDTCGTPAMLSLGIDTTVTLNQLDTTTQQLVSELQSSVQQMATFNTNVNAQLNEELYINGLLPDLEAFTARIVGEYQRGTKARSNLVDYMSNQNVTMMKQGLGVKEVLKTEKEVSNRAQPASGDIGPCKSGAVKSATVQQRQIKKVAAQALNNYNAKSEAVDKGMELRLHIKNANKDKEKTKLRKWFTEDSTLTEEELDNLNWATATVTNMTPLPNISVIDARRASAPLYETERRLWNSSVLAVQEVINDQVSDRIALVEPDWIAGYAGDTPSGKISLIESLSREIDGRIETPGWFQNIKQMPSSGLKREINYMIALENKLLLELIERKNHKNRLLALNTAKLLLRNKSSIERILKK